MTRSIVPIKSLQRRIPEAGRIRIGVKTATAMKAIDTFRFTSPDQAALDQVAAAYGGTVKPWSDPKAAPGQFEVITDAHEIDIVLPPDALGTSPIYELWSGGGCERRCDGVVASVIASGPDGPESVDRPCLCSAADVMKCEPHTRLNVILPQLRFTGVWRLESKSWNVAQEFPGFVDLICSLQERGLTRGLLRLEHRTSVFAGKTRKFVVPVLGVSESMDALVAGAAQVGAIGAGSSAPALGAGSSEEGEDRVSGADGRGDLAASPSDDDIIDAELVGEVDDRSLADVLPQGTTKAKALLAARKVAERQGLPVPSSIEECTGYVFVAAVLDELGLVPG